MPWLAKDSSGQVWMFNKQPEPIQSPTFPGEYLYTDGMNVGYPVVVPDDLYIGIMPVEVKMVPVDK